MSNLESKGQEFLSQIINFYELCPLQVEEAFEANRDKFSEEDISAFMGREDIDVKSSLFLISKLEAPKSIEIFNLAKAASEESSLITLKEVIKYLNKLEPSFLNTRIFSSQEYKISWIIQKRGLTRQAKPFFEKYLEIIRHPPRFKSIRTLHFAQILADLKILDKETASQIFEANKDSMNLKLEKLMKIVSVDATAVNDPEELFQFMSNSADFNLNALKNIVVTYFKWPESGSLDQELVEKFQKNLSSKNPSLGQILQFVEAIPLGWTPHKELRNQLLQASSAYINSSFENINKSICIRALNAFIKHERVKNMKLISKLMETLESNYELLTADEKLEVLSCLSRAGLRHESFTTMISEELKTKLSMVYQGKNSLILLSSLAELNYYKQDWAIELAQKVLSSNKNQNLQTKGERYSWLWALVCFNAKEGKILREINQVNKLSGATTFNFKELILANYFELNPVSEKLSSQANIPELNKMLDHSKNFGITLFLKNKIIETFKERNIEYQTEKEVNNVLAPFYLPKQDLVFWPTTTRVTLLQNQGLKGVFEFHKDNLSRVASKVSLANPTILREGSSEDISDWLKESGVEF